MEEIKLVSSDLNGTLVYQHTMQDMLRIYFPEDPQRYKRAKAAFSDQTNGKLSIPETFEIAGPMTRGLSLRQAIDYVMKEIRFLKGFSDFIEVLHKRKILLIINSTGYNVTLYALRSMVGEQKIYDVICNRLIFAINADPHNPVHEEELVSMVRDYVLDPKASVHSKYDEIQTTGEIKLAITGENAKADLIFHIARRLGLPYSGIAHIGDSMGDSEGICAVARKGGLGIAFHYNEALARYLEDMLEKEVPKGRIILIDPKGKPADLVHLLPYLTNKPLH